MGILSWLVGPCSPEAFARKMIAAHRNGPLKGEQFTYDPEAFALRTSGGTILGLTNAYNDYCRAPLLARRRVIATYAGLPGPAAVGLGDDVPWDEARGRLIPRVQSAAYYPAVRAQITLQGAGEAAQDTFADWPLAEGFGCDLVLDHENALQPVRPDQIAGWGQTPAAARAAALENLRRRSQEPLQRVADGLFVSPWQDTYDLSRLLVDELFRALPVRGRPVALAPNRKLLIVTGDDDADGLQLAAGLARQQVDEDRFVSGAALRLDGAAWTPFMPSRRHPAYAAFAELRYMTLARDYDDQKELLEKLNGRSDVDQYVASFSVMQQDGTGRLVSWAMWVEAVTDALLPRADVVAFARGDDPDTAQTVFAEWDRVRAVAGSLMEQTDHYPPRWRTRAFPTAEMRTAMGARDELWSPDPG